ncbi:[NiFe]-hydrogenase III large subunit [Candidatus Symbiobacter mobilis CR]|uniref:[NiFe]-hydrogenase III large subunit n=1 Tax=Candidatus Symbiobacter mobilis CR TaxID=946483 RepID=U5N8W6_9BURK|nr:[NiFe]-hydrogenase III large subunit [Candidatus Symbiobacter mobilis CR]
MPTPVPIAHAVVDAEAWIGTARSLHEAGARLVALWGSIGACGTPHIHAAFARKTGALWITLPITLPIPQPILQPDPPTVPPYTTAQHSTPEHPAPPSPTPQYPDLSTLFPAAGRMQRAAADLCGIVAAGAADTRPWLDHGAWFFAPGVSPCPLGAPGPHRSGATSDYPFIPVAGDGVHEIAVGPVHAGIIEPGHFRFSVVGEKILRLEERLGYTHKGIERRMTEVDLAQACRIAGRVCADSTVAYTWATCMALEAAAHADIPPRAQTLRAVLLERERVANHLGDLGALANDVAFAFALAQFSRLREDWLRASAAVFGHRWQMDAIVPGGVARDIDASQLDTLRQVCNATERAAHELFTIYEEHATLQDRFVTTGKVSPTLAATLGLTGPCARASSQNVDLRHHHPFGPYAKHPVRVAMRRNGDVAARAAVRFDELFESLRWLREVLDSLPPGAVRIPLAWPTQWPDTPVLGAGWVEGWRGEVWAALEVVPTQEGGHRLLRCHLHDPSWQNWLALEHAIIGDIVADFPLINKSFNLSYTGQDL